MFVEVHSLSVSAGIISRHNEKLSGRSSPQTDCSWPGRPVMAAMPQLPHFWPLQSGRRLKDNQAANYPQDPSYTSCKQCGKIFFVGLMQWCCGQQQLSAFWLSCTQGRQSLCLTLGLALTTTWHMATFILTQRRSYHGCRYIYIKQSEYDQFCQGLTLSVGATGMNLLPSCNNAELASSVGSCPKAPVRICWWAPSDSWLLCVGIEIRSSWTWDWCITLCWTQFQSGSCHNCGSPGPPRIPQKWPWVGGKCSLCNLHVHSNSTVDTHFKWPSHWSRQYPDLHAYPSAHCIISPPAELFVCSWDMTCHYVFWCMYRAYDHMW